MCKVFVVDIDSGMEVLSRMASLMYAVQPPPPPPPPPLLPLLNSTLHTFQKSSRAGPQATPAGEAHHDARGGDVGSGRVASVPGGRENSSGWPRAILRPGAGCADVDGGAAVGPPAMREGAGEGAAGGWWPVPGWFSRRSGMSPPPAGSTVPPLPSSAAAAGGAAVDGQGRVAGAGGGDGGCGEGETAGAAGGGGIEEGVGLTLRGGVVSPSPLPTELVEPRQRQRGEEDGGGSVDGHATDVSCDDDGDDEDDAKKGLYVKTLRPSSEQLVRVDLMDAFFVLSSMLLFYFFIFLVKYFVFCLGIFLSCFVFVFVFFLAYR